MILPGLGETFVVPGAVGNVSPLTAVVVDPALIGAVVEPPPTGVVVDPPTAK